MMCSEAGYTGAIIIIIIRVQAEKTQAFGMSNARQVMYLLTHLPVHLLCCLVVGCREAVFDVLVSDIAAAAAGSSDNDEEDSLAYCAQLDATQLAALLFERGAAEGVRARNRQVLYSISKELERAACKRRKLAAAAAAADVEQQQQPASEQKSKKKKKLEAEQQQQEQQQHEVAKEQQHEAPSTHKKKKKKQAQQDPVQELQLQPEQQPAANGVTPKSSKKQKKEKQLEQQQQLQNGHTTPSTPVAAAAAATPQPSSSKKKRKHGEATPAAAAAVTPQPAAAAARMSGAGGHSTSKKGVVIDLKKNIYFAHGAPVPPAGLRSPPNTKPKGSALKKGGGSVLGRLSRHGGSPHAPATAPAKQQQASRLPQQQQQLQPGSARKAVTPNSVPRVKASAFF
jgi:ribosomal RNA-processing protein 1